MSANVVHKQNNLQKDMEKINIKLKHNIPRWYKLVSTNATDMYLINDVVAKQFISLIQVDIKKNASHVIELNPGLGFITQQLLEIGIPFVYMYEREIKFIDILTKLHNKFPNKLSLQNSNLFNLSKSMHINTTNKSIQNAYNLLKHVQKKQWNEESCMQIIGATNKDSFLRHLILSAVFRTCFMAYGRPIFYLVVPPSMWDNFTGTAIKSSNIMFQTIFDYHVFGEVDRKAFVQWTRADLEKKLARLVQKDPPMTLINSECSKDVLPYLYVVKVEPKREIPVFRYGKEDLLYFWYFVRHNLYKPSMRVIPSMEKLIRGCGVRLIALNMNVFTQFNDLSLKQIQDLYLEFRSWPEFKESIYTSNVADVKSMYDSYLAAEEENHKTIITK
nr:dimethyladenosine transferase 2, mitochondrial [Megalopta genalis]